MDARTRAKVRRQIEQADRILSNVADEVPTARGRVIEIQQALVRLRREVLGEPGRIFRSRGWT